MKAPTPWYAVWRLPAAAWATLLFAACAPPMSFRPATPMLPGQTDEFGVGSNLGGELYPHKQGHEIGAGGAFGGGGQLWYYHQFGRFFDLGALAFGSSYTIAGAGLSMRFRIIRTAPFILAFEVTGGSAWAEGGLPCALRLSDRVWLYTAPGGGLGGGDSRDPIVYFRVPLGLSLRVNEHVLLLFEAQSQNFGVGQALISGGFALAYRF